MKKEKTSSRLETAKADFLAEQVAAIWGIKPSTMLGKGRDPVAVQCRQGYWWVLAKRGYRVSDIKPAAQRDHSTVAWGIRQTERRMAKATPPVWARDLWSLVNPDILDMVRDALDPWNKRVRTSVLAYLAVDVLYRREEMRTCSVQDRLYGLRALSIFPRVRAVVQKTFYAAGKIDPCQQILTHARRVGYQVVGDVTPMHEEAEQPALQPA